MLIALLLTAAGLTAIGAGIRLFAHAVLVSTTSKAIVRVAKLPNTGGADAANSIAIALRAQSGVPGAQVTRSPSETND